MLKEKGHFRRVKWIKSGHVSFIGFEAITAANERSGSNFAPDETRRNIMTEGADINELIDATFSIGEVLFRSTELCHPCVRPGKLSGKESFAEAFKGIGGLRAEILAGGTITVGQGIEL